MKNRIVLLLVLVVFASCNYNTTDQNDAPSSSVKEIPKPVLQKKSIRWVLENHAETEQVWEYEQQLICSVPDIVISEYSEGKFPNGNMDLKFICGKKVVRHGEENGRMDKMSPEEIAKLEPELDEQCNKVLRWLYEEKRITLPDFDPALPVWSGLYQNIEMREIKGMFERDYLPTHGKLVDSLRQWFTKYQFSLDNEIYQRIHLDTSKIIFVNTGSAHRRCQWQLQEEGFDVKVFQINETPEVLKNVKCFQFVEFLIFKLDEIRSMK